MAGQALIIVLQYKCATQGCCSVLRCRLQKSYFICSIISICVLFYIVGQTGTSDQVPNLLRKMLFHFIF